MVEQQELKLPENVLIAEEKMADPHNKKRYGETWDTTEINEYLYELECPEFSEPLRAYVTFSGGWAWHFMSPWGT